MVDVTDKMYALILDVVEENHIQNLSKIKRIK